MYTEFRPLQHTLRPRTMIMNITLIGLYAMDLRYCDQRMCNVFFFLVCVSRRFFHIWMKFFFCLFYPVRCVSYFVFSLVLCIVYNPFEMCVNIFIVISHSCSINVVYLQTYICIAPFLVFMSAPYPTHESWHTKR